MLTVRDGQKVWPYCEECGCRLTGETGIIGHWWGKVEKVSPMEQIVYTDARGHNCSKLIDFWILDDDGNLC